MKKVKLAAFIAVITLTGCAHQMTQEVALTSAARHEYQQNYKLGQRLSVAVGDPMIKVRDYFVEEVSIPAVVPSTNITIDGPVTGPMVFAANQAYPIRGRVEVEGTSYLVVPNTNNAVQWNAAMVRASDGAVYNRRLSFGPGLAGPVQVVYAQTVTPPDSRMLQKTEEKIVASRGYENYELIYNGVSNNAIQLTYREFSPEGLARTAFFQNVTYDAKAESIRFRKFRITIYRAHAEGIEYSVVEDGR